MKTEAVCLGCGAPLTEPSVFGQCPACLLSIALEDQTDLPTGDSKDYEIQEEIGRGAMGVVYRARQRSLKRTVALKMLTPYSASFSGVGERLRMEAETAANLQHPNIVSVYGVGERDGLPFFSMELISGNPMDKLLEQRRLGLHAGVSPAKVDSVCREIACLISTIARAVDYAHSRGVLHRDLKPSNVLIDENGEPHLTDFGLAKVFGRAASVATAPGVVIGTPAYMSPEAAAGGKEQVSMASDVYSLGAILYELLTGKPPFHAETPLETLQKVLHEEPVSPRLLNKALDLDLVTICLKCLDKDSANRYPTAGALADDLDRYVRGEPIASRPLGLAERLVRICKREPVIAGLTTLVFLLLAATAISAAIAYRASERRLLDSEVLRQRQLAALLNRIEKEWAHDNLEFIRVDAEEVAAMMGRQVTREGTENVLTLGIYASDFSRRPNRLLSMYAPLVQYIQNVLSNNPVIFDICVYKTHEGALLALEAGQVDLIRLSPASYVQIREKFPVVLLAKELYSAESFVEGAFFTHKSSGLTNLSSLRGGAVAIGFEDTALAPQIAELELLSAGLHAHDLTGIYNHKSPEILEGVRTGIYVAGTAELKDITQLMRAGAPLAIIKTFRTPGYVWVCRGGISQGIARGLQSSLMALQDRDLFATLERDLTDLVPANPVEYNTFARQVSASLEFRKN